MCGKRVPPLPCSNPSTYSFEGARMKKRLILAAAILVFATGSAILKAQTAAPAKTKIGVINIQAAIANTVEGKQIIADLQKKYAPRQAELQRLQQDIQDIQ